MSGDRGKNILICGANGVLGNHLLEQLGSHRAVAVTRHPEFDKTGFGHLLLPKASSLDKLPLANFRTIISAAGRVNGKSEELHQANVNFPVELARAAKNAGVRNFVQTSSFSVHGHAETIDHETAELPETDYGRSKAEADAKLLKLNDANFRVACVRIPFLFGPGNPALFAPLIRMIRLIRVIPQNKELTKRSMITYQDAAMALIKIAHSESCGKIWVADPQYFDFAMLQRILTDEGVRYAGVLRLSGLITKPLSYIFPSIHRRLLRSSVLRLDTNFLQESQNLQGIEAALRIIVRQEIKKKIEYSRQKLAKKFTVDKFHRDL